MANQPISMSNVRQIIKLYYTQNMGKKKIGERLGISKNTVKIYVDQYLQMKSPWDELSKLTDFELNKLFHPPKTTPIGDRLKELHAYFPIMEKQLRRRGMTVLRQHEEYRKLHPNGFGDTAFYKHFRHWSKKVNPTMHIIHKVGDKIYVDFTGAKLPYVDITTGEVKQGEVFVAILGWSQYAYVEVMLNQTIEEFIAGCENALRYLNGVPLALVPDNLKSAVFKANNYEPTVNENFVAFAEHYGLAILPARSRKPQDKAHVENMVKLTYQEIFTNLSEHHTFPIIELNNQVWQHLTNFNNGLLTGKDCSRADQLVMEQTSLSPLPESGYEIRKIKQLTLAKNGHVYLSDDQHYYSAPYELIGKKLKIFYSRTKVELYLNYELVASHKRLRSPHNYSTIASHMPASHQYVTEWSPTFFIEKARAIDPMVEYFISQVLARKQHPEQGYKSCMGILSFAKRVGHVRLIKACKRAHESNFYNYKIIDDILTKNLDQFEDEPETGKMPTHENIRGTDYYN